MCRNEFVGFNLETTETALVKFHKNLDSGFFCINQKVLGKSFNLTGSYLLISILKRCYSFLKLRIRISGLLKPLLRYMILLTSLYCICDSNTFIFQFNFWFSYFFKVLCFSSTFLPGSVYVEQLEIRQSLKLIIKQILIIEY